MSALAREFGVCRDTVRRELRRDGPAQYAREKPTELTAAQRVHVERRLAACASIRGTDLHHELVEQYSFTGSYASFQRQLRLLRPAVVREAEIRFETDPGDQAQTDWAHVRVWPVDGQPQELFALVDVPARSVAVILLATVDGLTLQAAIDAEGVRWPNVRRGIDRLLAGIGSAVPQ